MATFMYYALHKQLTGKARSQRAWSEDFGCKIFCGCLFGVMVIWCTCTSSVTPGDNLLTVNERVE